DGSTDDTAEIIRKYAGEHDFICYYYRQKLDGQAYFASNVCAIMGGYQQIKHLDYDYLAILDADITLPENYYQQIIERFRQDEKLGVASGIYENLIDGKLHKVLNDRRSTPKAIQVFRRECFEQIGGYLPLKYGGEDTCACIMARMKGWKSWSFPDIKVIHHRPTGTGNAKDILRAKYTLGLYEYSLGSHPLFVLIKSLRRCFKEQPYIIGGLVRIMGYLVSVFRHETRQIPDEVITFIRTEQLGRLINFNRIPKKNRINT
ncbi:MAG: glycosyltransferase family 2 protein, partial [Bacteroidales bacterium]|nr:glycosyltransferase family 2 protein [Bacteroidales bacterium]